MVATVKPGRRPLAGPPAGRPDDHATAAPARAALLGAAALGVLGDALLRQGPSGVGFVLFVLALLATLGRLTRARGVRWTLGGTLLVVPVIWFAAALAWRDSGALGAGNLLAMLAALSALSWALIRGDAWEPATAGVNAYVLGALKSGFGAATGALPLLNSARIGELTRDEAHAGGVPRRWPAVARGAAVAVPVVVVFGSLFSAADPVFERGAREVIDVDVYQLLSHLMFACFVAWPVAGFLRGSVVAPAEGIAAESSRSPVRLGVIEIGVALGSLNALFLAFVVVQLRYLFGGEAHVQATAGVTYAEYARRGFFELVWVTALTLGVLLAANGAMRRDRVRDERVFRGLAWTLLALLSVIMLSAVQRMRLYQSAYGLTETRFYASACMAWLAVVLGWFAATVLRGRGTPAFAFGAVVSAWLAVGALDVANPDAIIARTNLRRLDRGARFDAKYVTALSGDAVPSLARWLRDHPAAPPDVVRCTLEHSVARWTTPQHEDGWRTWNASRAAARRAARDSRLPAAGRAACPSDAPAGGGREAR